MKGFLTETNGYLGTFAGLPGEVLARAKVISIAKSQHKQPEPVARERVFKVRQVLATLRNCEPQQDNISSLIGQARALGTSND
jgi:hypothetical protein